MLDSATIAPEHIRPLRRSEYERLVELGCFADERVELLAGNLVAKSPQGPRHAWIVQRLTMLLVSTFLGRASVRIELPLALSDDSEPEPDVAVVPTGDYSKGHPTGAFLVVEVSDTSLPTDRGIKAGLYARAGIPEYWVVNLVDEVIEVHTTPEADAYRTMSRCGRGESIAPVAFPDVALPVADIL